MSRSEFEELKAEIEDLRATLEIFWHSFFFPAVLKVEKLHRGTAEALIESITRSERMSVDGLPDGLELREIERRYTLRELERCNGNIRATARSMNVDPKTIRNKLREWGMTRREVSLEKPIKRSETRCRL